MTRKKYTYEDYNKEKPTVEATKYFIIYEGKIKEPNYFEAFRESFIDAKKAYVGHVLEKDTDIVGNTPLKLKQRAENFIKNPPKNIKVTPQKDDKFRFVLDVDKHPQNHIDELEVFSDSLHDSEIYISNYCFEIWLWAHFEDLNKIKSNNSKKMKTELGKLEASLKIDGFPHSYMNLDLIKEAIVRCRKSDYKNTSSIMPNKKSSKVYLLMIELIKHIDK